MEGRYSRGYLPHIEAPGVAQFVTWRLSDALPASAVEAIKAEMSRRVEAYCDAGAGECLLRDPRVARVCQETLFAHHRRLYRLHAWAVMPNHVHALLTPETGVSLANAMHRIKGGSSHAINRLLGRRRLWQPESLDRWIRDERHFEGVRNYIEWNPVKARLCRDPKLQPWSSANDAAWARFGNLPQDKSCDPCAD